MRNFEKTSVGDPLSAAKMNALIDMAGIATSGVPNSGSVIFGSMTANGDVQHQPPAPLLVFATEAFKIQVTDNSIADDCPSGLCNFVDLARGTNAYTPQTDGRPFYVYDPVSEFADVDSKLALDVFHIIWNAQSKRWEVLATGGSTGDTGGGNKSCLCTCIENGDIVVNGIVTSSQWGIQMQAISFEQDNGEILFPAGDYIIVYDGEAGIWTLDIGDRLTAIYNDGEDATEDSTLDGTITMTWTAGTVAEVKLCVDGVIPPPP